MSRGVSNMALVLCHLNAIENLLMTDDSKRKFELKKLHSDLLQTVKRYMRKSTDDMSESAIELLDAIAEKYRQIDLELASDEPERVNYAIFNKPMLDLCYHNFLQGSDRSARGLYQHLIESRYEPQIEEI